jgi:hypothetical protein
MENEEERVRESERRKTLIIEIFRIEPHLKNGLRYVLAPNFEDVF